MKQLYILSGAKSIESDENLVSMACFMGVHARVLELGAVSELISYLSADSPLQESDRTYALHADILLDLYRQDHSRDDLRNRLESSASELFVYGCSPQSHDECVQWLTRGLVKGINAVEGAGARTFPPAGQKFTHQLAGSQYSGKRVSASAAVFDGLSEELSALPLITIEDKPSFLCVQRQNCNLFFTTISDLPKPQQRVFEESDLEGFYDELLPVLVFLREAFRESCWHGGDKAARLIIDDPALRRKYGCLDFSVLFNSLRKHRYAASVAYIPWNHFRTPKKLAPFFLLEADRFSICVHGCDHTNNEYGVLDENLLHHKSRLAILRMKQHEVRTGIGFDPVMVFPQGLFSAPSLRALQSNGFLAAINSTRFSVGGEHAAVQLGDLLLPAFSRLHGLPVFLRHYPDDVFPFLFDLFLGRPAFIVEHHEFFKDGLSKLESLVHTLNNCEPKLSWADLPETLKRVCWKRAISKNTWEIMFFTDEFLLTNEFEGSVLYKLVKHDPEPGMISAILLNGDPALMSPCDEGIRLELSLKPGETVHVRLQRRIAQNPAHIHASGLYQSKVLLRRFLSEVRDELLVQHPRLLSLAKLILRTLRTNSILSFKKSR
jgi:hypothetical protein